MPVIRSVEEQKNAATDDRDVGLRLLSLQRAPHMGENMPGFFGLAEQFSADLQIHGHESSNSTISL